MSVPLPSAISNASPASVDTELLGGRYSLGPRIGEGGMGVVHAGFDERLARPVAIKLLDMRRADDASVTRFRREAMLLARLSHPHIVAVHDVEARSHQAYLVMERLEGEDLFTRAERPGQDRCALALRVGPQIASALGAMHRLGIVHRDLKPDNVVCMGEGVDTCAKLIDFGIAVEQESGSRVTALHTIVGTPAYLAPERLESARTHPSADIYGLGAVLYEVLSGAAPFEADSVAETLYRLATSAPPPLVERARVRSEDERARYAPLFALVHRMLARDPAARPSLTDIGAELARIADVLEPNTTERAAVAWIRPVDATSGQHLAGWAARAGGSAEWASDDTLRLSFDLPEHSFPTLRRASELDLRVALHVGRAASWSVSAPAPADQVTAWLLRYAVPGEVLVSAEAHDDLGPASRGDLRLHGGFDDGHANVRQVYVLRATGGHPGRLPSEVKTTGVAHGVVRCQCGACQELPAVGLRFGARLLCSQCSQPLVVEARALTDSVESPDAPSSLALHPCARADADDPVLDELASL